MKELSTLWVGSPLRYTERLCLMSALDTGHKVILYTYTGCDNAPSGIELRDAREVMPESFLCRHSASGSYALAANIFRYFLLSKRDTTWFDADMFFLHPIPDDDYIFGWEDQNCINSAILRLPSESQALRRILAFALSNPIIAPWWKHKRKISQLIRSLVGRHTPLEKLEWGIIGPKAVTYFAQHNGIAHYAAPVEVYYPNHYDKAGDAFDPNIDFPRRFTDKTIAVHLWNEKIKQKISSPPPRGSFIAQQCARLGIKYN